MCVADSSFPKQLSQIGLSVNPVLKGCPFRRQCPWRSPATYCNWFPSKFKSSLVLLAEGPCVSPFTCLSPVTNSQCFLWSLLAQSLTAFLATTTEMPQAGSGPINGHSDPYFASWSAISLPTIPSWPGTHFSWKLLCLVNCTGDWWQSQTNFELIW
jgi:hypothetical protein